MTTRSLVSLFVEGEDDETYDERLAREAKDMYLFLKDLVSKNLSPTNSVLEGDRLLFKTFLMGADLQDMYSLITEFDYDLKRFTEKYHNLRTASPKEFKDRASASLDRFKRYKEADPKLGESDLVVAIVDLLRDVDGDQNFLEKHVLQAGLEKMQNYPGDTVDAAMYKVGLNDPKVEWDKSVKQLTRAVIRHIALSNYAWNAPSTSYSYEMGTISRLKKKWNEQKAQVTTIRSKDFGKFLTSLKDILKNVSYLPDEDVEEFISGSARGRRELGRFGMPLSTYEVKMFDAKSPEDIQKEGSTNRWNSLVRFYVDASFAENPEDVKIFLDEFKKIVDKWTLDYFGDPEELNKLPPEVPEEDLNRAPMGKFAFAPARPKQVPYEKNTREEDDIYRNLVGHVKDNESMEATAAEAIKDIVDNNWYSEIFKTPKEKVVYRGMRVTGDFLADLQVSGFRSDTKTSGSHEAAMTFRPKSGGSSSWSIDVKQAKEFAVASEDKPYVVVMCAKLDDNPDSFVKGTGGFYKLKPLAQFDVEDEAIGLEDIKVYKIYWQNKTKQLWGGDHNSYDRNAFQFDADIKESKKTRLLSLRESVNAAVMREADIADVSDVCFTAGSTHVMKTCKIGGDKYFLKFSDESLFEDVDPSLQILVEYLAYRIYALYSGINVPHPELVYDSSGNKVGLATSPAPGQMALKVGTDPKLLAKMMSQGVYVDVFLANWDVIGTGSGNVFVDKDRAIRIDPGGSLTFRAQGGRKDAAFGSKVKELSTMFKAGTGTGDIYKHADLKAAAKEFLAVDWSTIEAEIDDVAAEVSEQLLQRKMKKLLSQWKSDVDYIRTTLAERHSEVEDHAQHVLSS